MSGVIPPWDQLLLALVGLSPYLLALLLGAALCLRNASLQPRRSLLAGMALGIMAINLVATSLLLGYVYSEVQQATNSHEIAMVTTRLVSAFPAAVSLLLMLWAVFHGDGRPRETD